MRERKLRHDARGDHGGTATATAGHRPHGDDQHALCHWLQGLEGGPAVTRTEPLACTSAAHADPAAWFFAEADPSTGIARRRCLACGEVTGSLDSQDRWTYPPMWACPDCGQSICELAAGLAVDAADAADAVDATDAVDGEQRVTWVALGARCVACGCLAGLTDFVLPGVPADEVLARL